MKTYAYTKDRRIKLYIGSLAVSIILYALLDWFLLKTITVDKEFEMLVNLILSLISFSGINAILLTIVGIIYPQFIKANGTYKIQLTSSHNKTVIEGKLTVKIGLQRAKVILKTDSSQSVSDTLVINNDDKDKIVITYTYLNEGNYQEGHKLSKHTGTCLLTFENGKLTDGKYYTDEFRQNYGMISEIEKDKESDDKKQ